MIKVGFSMYMGPVLEWLNWGLSDTSSYKEWPPDFTSKANLRLYRGYYLVDNDRSARVLFAQHPREQGEWLCQNPRRSARVLFVQHPRGQGEWCSQNPSVAGRMMQSKPERGEGFDVIIRPAPEGAGRTTLEQIGHYSHYNTKLTNSRYFHGNSYRIAFTEPPLWPCCSWKSSEHCHTLCT